MTTDTHILVIRLGALGDIVRSFGTMAAIRAAHPAAKITLLTTPPFADFMRRSPFFDDIWDIPRWHWTQVTQWAGFRAALSERGFSLVYDLQRNDRTGILKRLAPAALRRHWFDDSLPLPGLAAGAPWRADDFPLPAADWLDADIGRFNLPPRFVLLVPGCAPRHPEKRWPAAHYAALAETLQGKGYGLAAIGTAHEAEVIGQIKERVPALHDLSNQTSFADIAALARQAGGAVGNDTGPMHLVALAACPTVSLFSGRTNPAQSKPLGPAVTVLQREPLAALPVAEVEAALSALMSARITPPL